MSEAIINEINRLTLIRKKLVVACEAKLDMVCNQFYAKTFAAKGITTDSISKHYENELKTIDKRIEILIKERKNYVLKNPSPNHRSLDVNEQCNRNILLPHC